MKFGFDFFKYVWIFFMKICFLNKINLMFVWIIIICVDEILEIYILYILFDVIYYEINLFFLN